MKKLYLLIVLCVISTMISCKKESLQGYLIETQENTSYTRLDFSTSMLASFLENASEEDKGTFESVKKVNIAFLPMNKATEEEINVERKRLKTIMKDTDYKSLIRINDKRGKGTIYYAGEADAIDEIVAVFYVKEFGFGVARVLGENMNPAKVMSMVQKTNLEKNGPNLEKIKDMFGGEFETEKLRVEPVQ
ncbi:DUF4252 domain-containing protein [Tenacibaculum amylolyticum]|uniref:DUF4252 domain-containing protein n=1 Tax=Tenacibaculum amylolyticum TaxID=104269 RepID=UPI003893C38B